LELQWNFTSIEKNSILVIVRTWTGLGKNGIWHKNYLTTVDVWQKVAGNTRGLVVHVRSITNQLFLKLRNRWGK